jgi:hypothetical protein
VCARPLKTALPLQLAASRPAVKSTRQAPLCGITKEPESPTLRNNRSNRTFELTQIYGKENDKWSSLNS